MLYERLDGLRERAETGLAGTLTAGPGGTAYGGSPVEREAVAARHQQQLAQLHAAEEGLCFGRLDMDDGECRYVGRLGIFDEEADYAPLLIDWRAPAARPFYTATGAAPQGVRRRRHIRTDERTVVRLQDEVLDLTDRDAARADPSSDAALLAALTTARTGHMSDIVTTIQAEQDRVIRSDHRGVLVVEGGPGTGKTAVALHRAAYLLYTHREQLASRGVLIVGPNPTFLRYIDQVLPSLGESAVRLSAIEDLLPGVRAEHSEAGATAEVKGRAAMAEVVAAAVRDRQQVPERVRELRLAGIHPSLGYQPDTVVIDPATCERARERARATRRPHHLARPVFVEQLLADLARQLADRLGHDPYAADPLGGGDAPGEGTSLLGEADVADLTRELRQDPAVQAMLDELWPVLSPQRLLSDLFASAERLDRVATALTPAERRLLHRTPGQGWTPADIPLLDEAAELLGEQDGGAPAGERRRQEAQVAYARGVLDIAAGSAPVDSDGADEPEELTAADLLTAEQLAGRQQEVDTRTIAERSAADRRWMFGHVVVDEAQELPAMAWRMLMRRCPARWMTVVGDPAQASSPVGGGWEERLAPHVGDRWRLERLTLNYRTPAEIMALATAVLRQHDPSLPAPRSVRRTGVAPARRATTPDGLHGRVVEVVAQETAEVADGRTAVIVPADLQPAVGRAVIEARTDAAVGPDPTVLQQRVAVLTARQAKGLEFDAVVVVEPDRIGSGAADGVGDLYVALSRATRRLTVVHTGALPAGLASALAGV